MITENYIKMCEQAEEIQSEWMPKDWDRFAYCDSREMGVACVDGKEPTKKELKENLMYRFWLPTQEQLQGIVLTKNILENTWTLGWLINNIYCFMENEYEYVELPEHYAFKNFKEVNELLLAFVMYRKYNKIWTGEKWVKYE